MKVEGFKISLYSYIRAWIFEIQPKNMYIKKIKIFLNIIDSEYGSYMVFYNNIKYSYIETLLYIHDFDVIV